jgi:hypothetical protein
MGSQSETSGFTIPWGKVAGMALLIVAVIYAVQHPHSFFYFLVKLILIPVP